MAAGDTQITIVGNLVDDPSLKFTPSGQAVTNFRVASTPRFLDKQTNEWKDGEGLFLTCSVWRQAAENAAETLTRGMRVIVQGQLKQRSYEDRDQVKRTVYEIDVHEVGPSLARASAKVTKNPAGGGQRNPTAQPPQQAGRWGDEQPAATAAPAAGGYSDEPPF